MTTTNSGKPNFLRFKNMNICMERRCHQGETPMVISGQIILDDVPNIVNFESALPIMEFLRDSVIAKWLTNDELVEIGNDCDSELLRRRKEKEAKAAAQPALRGN